MPKEEMDVVYETEGWTSRQRAELTETLLGKGIPHEWYGTDMTVARQYEAIVDGILARPAIEINLDTRQANKVRPKGTLFKHPIYSDWCAWLGALAVATGIYAVSNQHSANLIDYVFAIVVQWTLFAGAPAIVRRELYRRHT